jgi:cyclopropane fatty-acyl-phospholipid synthase-like methyltransferase
LVNKKSDNLKIYGYDEELWYRVIREDWKNGDEDTLRIATLLQEHHAGNRILDLGCGVGRISTRLALRGYSVVGVDLSNHCIAEAERLAMELGVADKTRYVVGDYRELEKLVEGKFDVATCILAQSWTDLSDFTVFFSKLAAYMKPNAVIVLQATLKECFLQALYSCPNVQSWYKIEGGMLSLHHWSYDPETNIVHSSKEFYAKTATGFNFITKIVAEFQLKSISEYTAALRHAGWDVLSVIKPGTFDVLKTEEYNSPWWMNSATILARLK